MKHKNKKRSIVERSWDEPIPFISNPSIQSRVFELIEGALPIFSSETELEQHYLSHLPEIPSSKVSLEPKQPSPPVSLSQEQRLGLEYMNNLLEQCNIEIAQSVGSSRREEHLQELDDRIQFLQMYYQKRSSDAKKRPSSSLSFALNNRVPNPNQSTNSLSTSHQLD